MRCLQLGGQGRVVKILALAVQQTREPEVELEIRQRPLPSIGREVRTAFQTRE
jgi:hypothetical protein